LSSGDFTVFLGVAALVIVTPGQDTVLTVRNALSGGTRAGFSTALGVSSGQATWAAATSSGIGAVVLASETALLVIRLVGSAYLLYLGTRTILEAARRRPAATIVIEPGGHVAPRTALRQGLFSNLANPKMAAFFTGLLPQFATSFLGLLGLGLLFCSMTLVWLSGYALAVSKAEGLLRRPRVVRMVEACTGAALIALGLRLAAGGWVTSDRA
jgi:threonine/homoserine/homoserine lactone efflux protein